MVQAAERTKRRHPTAESSGESGRSPRSSRRTPVSSLSLRAPAIQPKLTVNQPGDKYEQEADAIASRVVHTPISQPDEGRDTIQRQPEDDSVQMQVAEKGTVQRQEEEEPVQMQPEENSVQMQADNEEPVQRQAEGNDEESVQTQPAETDSQTQADQDNSALIQQQPAEDEEETPIQRKGGGAPSVSVAVVSAIRHPGSGSPLPASTRRRIEPHVGANLSGVRVHSDTSAHRAASSLQARAFTHHNHIFLNKAESSSDLSLMGHESTHVVQQGASNRSTQEISRQPQPISAAPANAVQAKAGDGVQRHPVQSRIVSGAKSQVGLIETYTDSGEKREVGGQTINVRQEDDQLQAIIQATAPRYAATETETTPAPVTAVTPESHIPAPLPPRSSLEPSPAENAALSAESEAAVLTEAPEDPPSAEAPAEVAAPSVDLMTPEPPASLTSREQTRMGQVRSRVGSTAEAESTLPAAESNVAGARAAVAEPQPEAEARAEGQVVAAVSAQAEPVPSIESICRRIEQIINAEEPKNEKDLVNFGAEAAADSGQEELNQSVEGDAERIQGSYNQLDQPPTAKADTQTEAINTPPSDVAAPDIEAEAAVPEPVELDLEADVTASSERISAAGMDAEQAQLAAQGAPEGPIATGLGAQAELETSAQQDVPAVLAEQDQILGEAGNRMATTEATAENRLNNSRTNTIGGVLQQQTAMVSEEDRLRVELSTRAQEIVETARQQVGDRLKPLPQEALRRWETGKSRVVDKFEDDLKNVTRWVDENKNDLLGGIVTFVFGLPDWIERDFRTAKRNFVAGICQLLRDVSAYVDSVIAECERIIEDADGQHQELFNQDLPAELQEWAEQERQKFSDQLDDLRNQVSDAQASAARQLAAAAVEAAESARDRIKNLRSQARGWLGRIADAIAEFAANAARFIIDGLLNLVGIQPSAFWAVVDKIGQAIDDIANDPMNFARNLLSAIGQGFEQFFDRFSGHMLDGLLEWLFSGLGSVGVQIPTDLSLKSIITFFLQLMGITWNRIRTILAKHIGEENVELLEKAYELVATLIEQGPEGIFAMIKEKLDPQAILDQVLEAAVDFLIEALVTAASARIILLFNPVGAIAQAIEAIYRVLKWVFENAARIFSLIETVVNGITKIIAGDISGMADAVEGALAKLIAPVVDFLAGYMGFGDLPDKIANTIRGFQEWIEGLLDQAIGWLVDRAKALLQSLGIGGEEEPDQAQEGDGEYDGQVGKVVNFNAAGKSHRLFIEQQSGNAVVMMASQEKPVTEQLDEYNVMAQEFRDEDKKSEAIGLINQAQNILSGLDTKANELVNDLTSENSEDNADKISAQDDAVERDQDRLVSVLKQIKETLGLNDTEALKEETLNEVEGNIKGKLLGSLEEVNSIMSQVYTKYQPEGLLTLAIKVINPSTMDVEVEASASEKEMRRIAWKDIFSESELKANQEIEQLRESLSLASQASYAAVAVDGQQVGSRSESGSGYHAEEKLVRGPSWTSAIQAAQNGVQNNGTSQITLMINRTPCAVCVVWLTEAIAEAKAQLGIAAGDVKFVLAATGTYRRQARMTIEDKAVLKAGVESLSKKQGRPFDEVYQEQEAIWKEDLRSFSTEWKDHDSHEDITSSGLTGLASAGWQIAGLDAGQPLTARQIELSELAAKLAEAFGWSS